MSPSLQLALLAGVCAVACFVLAIAAVPIMHHSLIAWVYNAALSFSAGYLSAETRAQWRDYKRGF